MHHRPIGQLLPGCREANISCDQSFIPFCSVNYISVKQKSTRSVLSYPNFMICTFHFFVKLLYYWLILRETYWHFQKFKNLIVTFFLSSFDIYFPQMSKCVSNIAVNMVYLISMYFLQLVMLLIFNYHNIFKHMKPNAIGQPSRSRRRCTG